MSSSSSSNRRGAVGEITIKTSIRIRPWSQQERETFPGPSPVQAAPGEVRVFHRAYMPGGGSGRSSPSHLARVSRPATPTSPHLTPRGASSPSLVWRQQAAAQTQLSSEYQSYPFANVFGPEESSEDVYAGSGCKDVVGSVLGGCNGTIFVYGQTGAGKTFTMDAVTDLVLQQLYAAADDAGSEVAISVSAVELYNEVLRCLLSGRENLQLRWASGAGSVNGVVLEGAEERPCGSIEEAAALVTMAKASRAVGETRANARSSRSHLIVRVKVEVLQLSNLTAAAAAAPGSPTAGSTRRAPPAAALSSKGSGKAPPATVTFSMLNLVDLAGSERIDKTGSSDSPLRLREALNINKSLLCLGNVVNALAERAEGRRTPHIPYRDSKLTRLLEDSLGGNATTALVACITPLPEWNLEQSRNTLEFAARAARIVCKPQRNVLSLGPAGGAAGASGDAANLIASLQAEVEALKKQLSDQQQQGQQPASAPSPQPQLHALPVQPVSSSNTLWNGSSRAASVLAGVAENADSDGGRGLTAASCPSSPTGRHSLKGRPAWTNRLRISLGGSPAASDGTGVEPAAAAAAASTSRLFGSRSFHHFPSRIPSPKGHSIFSGLTSPRACGGGEALSPAVAAAVQGLDRSQSDDSAVARRAAARQARGSAPAGQPPSPAAAGGDDAAANQVLPAAAQSTSRASGTHKSLLWKLLQQPHGFGDRNHSSQPGSSSDPVSSILSSGIHSGQPASLKSAGLLITSSGNAASAAAAAAAANAPRGLFARWASLGGGRSSPGCAAADAATAPQLLLQAASLVPGARSSIGINGDLLASSSAGIAAGRDSVVAAAGAAASAAAAAGGSASLFSRASAADAAMALRDHIIKQLVLALQQKKAEIRSLKEQLAAVLKQLEGSEGEEVANKGKLRELAEGIQMLAAARQQEFEKWKGHLVGLEAALQTAQQEAVTYRDESQSLVQQLTELQARYDGLQTEQQHHSQLVNVPVAKSAQEEQFLECLTRLQAIEAALQNMLLLQPEAVNNSSSQQGSPISRSRAATPRMRQLLPPPQEDEQMQPQQPDSQSGSGSLLAAWPPAASAGRPGSKGGEVTSHQIQTVTTRLIDAGSRLATAQQGAPAGDFADSLAQAAEAAATEARLSHVEFVLVELQELMPLVRAATQAAAHGFTAGSVTDNSTEAKQQQDQAAHRTREAKAGAAGGLLLPAAAKCHKCDSLKPLLVIMQKLKDEVVLLKAALRNRDSKLAAAEESAAEMKADLGEAKQQVGALLERIDELSEDLELARSAAAAAAAVAETMEAAAAAAWTAADAAAAAGGGSSSGDGAGATTRSVQPLQPLQSLHVEGGGGAELLLSSDGTQSPGRELSQREVGACRQVPLMGEDTPLEDLHSQILQSWQALAMPFAYRCAFVLGPNSSSSSMCGVSTPLGSSSTTTSSSSGNPGDDHSAADGSRSSSSSGGGNAAGSSSSSSSSSSTPSAAVSTSQAGEPAAAAAAETAAAVPQGGVRQAPWHDRGQCQAHVALLACLHQYHEDEPTAAEQQQEVLQDEGRVVDAGLALLPAEQLAKLLQHWGVAVCAEPSDATTATAAAEAQRAELLAKLWLPGSRASPEALAADSAAACQMALRAAPPTELAAVSLRCNASVLAAASNALADAAS